MGNTRKGRRTGRPTERGLYIRSALRHNGPNFPLERDPQQLTFALNAQGPAGWSVSIQPTGEANAASVTVDARGTQRLEVKATAPAEVAAGEYPIQVAVASGQYQAGADLAAIVTGKVEMQFVTPDQRLNTSANAGSSRDMQVVVVNTGTSPLRSVTLSGTEPSRVGYQIRPGDDRCGRAERFGDGDRPHHPGG